MEKLIFLDIDGVLNSFQTSLPFGEAPLDPVNIIPFNRIIAETQAEIVISSLWRFWHPLPEIKSMFKEAGILGTIIDATPIIDSCQHRGTTIYEWLKINRPSFFNFVLLDDRGDMEPFLDKLVMTKFDLGLTEDLADEVIGKF